MLFPFVRLDNLYKSWYAIDNYDFIKLLTKRKCANKKQNKNGMDCRETNPEKTLVFRGYFLRVFAFLCIKNLSELWTSVDKTCEKLT